MFENLSTATKPAQSLAMVLNVRRRDRAATNGVRAAKTRDKQQRIRAAARELFSKRGYDKANLRQIATRAGVGLGTLFHYARDKRDLVFLIFNDEFASVVQNGLNASANHHGVVDRLVAACATHYHFFKRDVRLSRILLRELIFYSEGLHSQTFLQIRRTFLLGLRRIVREGQADGQLRADRSSKTIVQLVFLLFAAEIRWWIAGEEPDVDAGLTALRHLLQMALDGISGPRRRRPIRHRAIERVRS